MPTPPSTPSATLTPAQLAKAALKRLAEQRLEPTPDNYRRAYEAESGVPSAPAATPDKPADKAAAPNEAQQDTDDGERWSSLITRILRGAERGGRQWTTARKKDSLKRVLDGSKSSATRLHQRLTQLVGSWDSDTLDNSLLEGDEATADTPAASTDDNAAAAPAQASTATTAALSATTPATTPAAFHGSRPVTAGCGARRGC